MKPILRQLSHKVSRSSPHAKRWLHLLLMTAASFGFTTQVMQVSVSYFKYRTFSQVLINAGMNAANHSVALCTRYIDILDKKRLLRETGIKVHAPPLSYDDQVSQERLLTIAQIFNYTPAPVGLISRCFYRPNDWKISWSPGAACEREFFISRFMTQEHMCYSFAASSRHPAVRFKAVSESIYQGFYVRSLVLNDRFAEASMATVIAFMGDMPYVSRDFAFSSVLRSMYAVRGRRPASHNFFRVTPTDFVIKRQPPPYDTDCRLGKKSSDRYTCAIDCIYTHYRWTGVIPTNELITRPLDLKVLGLRAMDNETELALLTGVQRSCYDRCFFTPCFVEYTKTHVLEQMRPDAVLGFSLKTATMPTLISQALPSQTFVEYFSFTCGCFGIWFGASFLSLDRFLGTRSSASVKTAASREKSGTRVQRRQQRQLNQPFIINIVNPSERVARILRPTMNRHVFE